MNRVLRVIGVIVLVILVLLIAVVGYVFAASNTKLNATHDYDAVSFDIPDEEETIAEGERIFITRGCGSCHAADGGGDPEFINDPALGHIPAPNLTSGGGYTYTIEDYVRAIQHGVGHDGRGLIIMPSQVWQKMPEAELVPLVAYLMQLEPVDRATPERVGGPVGRALLAFGILPLAVDVVDHDNAGFLEIEAEPSVEYGAYLSGICADCHGANFAGQADPGDSTIISPNITSHADGIGDWSLEDFTVALRTGQRPDGTVIDAAHMPWPIFAQMTDIELEAIYNFLQSTEPVAGN